MVRTKKHFRPPSPEASSSSSSEEEEEPNYVVQRGRGKQLNFGGGKQLSMAPAGGRGKQLRAPQPENEEESSEESSSEEEEDEAPPPSRGKMLRPMGRGKQLRAPSPEPAAAAKEESDSDSSTTSAYKQPSQQVAGRGGGKQFGKGMGKQLRRPSPTVDKEDSSSSSEEEPWAPPVRGQGKQLRPPPAAAAAPAKEESDMEESSEEEEEEEQKKPEPPKKVTKKPPAKKAAPKKKPEPEPEEEEEEEADDDSEESEFEPEQKAPPPKRRGRPPRAAAAKAAKSARAAAKKEISSEEEEEEASDDESSSDEEQELDMETFDMNKLVKGDDDQKYLDSMNELERENILAERFEKLKSEADMKKALRENKRREREQKKSAGGAKKKKTTTKKRAAPAKAKKAAPAKKKRAAKAPVEESSEEEEEEEEAPDVSGDARLAESLAGKRVSARNLVKKGKQFKKQAALAKIRENRANKAAVADESDSELDYGRDSDDSDDDYEDELKPWQKKGKKTTQLAENSEDESMGIEDDQEGSMEKSERRSYDIDAELEDYMKVSIPRRRLMRWCNEPFFEKAVTDFYVRLGIGRDNKSQKACYRLCQIKGIQTKSEYSFPAVGNQKPITTDKWLKVSFGKFERDFKMITVSDHRPSQEDVTKLVSQLKTERLVDDYLTKKKANKWRKKQDELVNNYNYTKEDIEMLVKEKKKGNKKALNIGMEKTRIDITVQGARDEVEEMKRRLEDAKIEEMEADDDMGAIAKSNVTKANEALEAAEKKLEGKEEEQKGIHKDDADRMKRIKGSSKVQNWAKVNQRAKMANRDADFQAYKEQQAREKEGQGKPAKFEPFARRRMVSKNLWEVNPGRAGDKRSDAAVEEEKKETTPSERDDANVVKENGKENKRDDVPEPQKIETPGQPNQFAFDDDIMMGGDIALLGGIGTKKVRTKARKGLSLDEYQEKKTAGTL